MIDDETLLPKRFKTATITIPVEIWEELVNDSDAAFMIVTAMTPAWGRVPVSDIKAELQKIQECPNCGGLGTQCPAGPSDAPLEICPQCEGAKTIPATIPGAHLLTDKLRLEVS